MLNELQARLPPGARIGYWRSKHGNEVDFVVLRRGQPPAAVECRWSRDRFDGRNLSVFRRHYPGGPNYLVAHDVDLPQQRTYSGQQVQLTGLADLVEELAGRRTLGTGRAH